MRDYEFEKAKSFTTPLSNTHLNNIDGEFLTYPMDFCKLSGTLHYLRMTSPIVAT